MAKLLSLSSLRPLDYTLIAGPILTATAYTLLTGEFDTLGFIVLVAGVMGVVLSANRSILNFFFGLINVGVYGYIALESQYYGGAALHLLYYAPMQFIGYWAWRKRKDEGDQTKVQSRSMSRRQMALWGVVIVVASAILWWILATYTDDSQPLKDAAITIIAIVAQYLMTCAYWEQWILWLMINLLSVTLWTVATINGEPHAALMVVKYAFYTINAINAIYIWRKNKKG